MGTKRFHTRRHWHNTLLMAWLVPVMLLMGVLVFAWTGQAKPLIALGVLGATGIAVALMRDMGNRSTYALVNGKIVLQGGGERLELDIEDISDASLVDRAAAREYIRTRLKKEGVQGRRAIRRRMRQFVRFCSVDVGLTSFTMGLGRSMIDRMPNARNDLVLLRIRKGEDLLLSPQYNQDLVATINQHVGLNRRERSDAPSR
jgi:hypothetical protein